MVTVEFGVSDVHCKSLVEIHVADVTTTGRRIGQTNLGVKVGTIKVDLTTVIVNNLAGLLTVR